MRAFVFPDREKRENRHGPHLAETFGRTISSTKSTMRWTKNCPLIFEGSDDDLRLTENTQPALMAVSLAVVRALG